MQPAIVRCRRIKARLVSIEKELRREQISPQAIALLAACGHTYLGKREGTPIERYLFYLEIYSRASA